MCYYKTNNTPQGFYNDTEEKVYLGLVADM